MQLFTKRIDVREEDIFSELHHFLLRKNNRYLTNDELVELTGVSSELLYKWVKAGKLKKSIFPNLGAPCERCGQITQAKICVSCSSTIVSTLKQEEKDRTWFNQIQRNNQRASTYHYK
ncbi:hypothetical protein [Lysinibacillus xylanilyticus]|uniref:Flagellar protein n=1 Tax=Lysinibacillus xylanilyticus TaxID=582475 RepID=A0ABT4ERQ2_9BACI|nr:hypothetical protein [Lysinibacillus xylanilyticus]MCY9548349.1 hypothetical protein [Lysinibacillus xylanilyticus]MED3803384.1 hypothetical protein [Lysinibacillus xylanilyticus]